MAENLFWASTILKWTIGVPLWYGHQKTKLNKSVQINDAFWSKLILVRFDTIISSKNTPSHRLLNSDFDNKSSNSEFTEP